MNLCGKEVGISQPLFVIAGPCVIESEQLALSSAEVLRSLAESLGVHLIYKSSFDKANRSSASSYRGPGIEEGLRILEKVRNETGLPVLTDVHEDTPLDEVASVVDVVQTPAFLCRQTNFIRRVAATGKPVNIKKGQFLAPGDMRNVVDKAVETGNNQIMVCERGVSFGYNNLISDMRSLAIMRDTGCPVVFDATHSVQLPGGLMTSCALARASATWAPASVPSTRPASTAAPTSAVPRRSASLGSSARKLASASSASHHHRRHHSSRLACRSWYARRESTSAWLPS
ncbi:MAG: 3-deoxy-8-phosphooctulonate synthase, partial [Pseudomonadota bacterium]